MKKNAIVAVLIIMLCSMLIIFNGCGDPWEGYTTVNNKQELTTALADTQINKIRVKSGNYGSVSAYDNIVITRPMSIKGDGSTKPVIFGSIVINLPDDITEVVAIQNLEISHSGLYVKKADTNTVDLTKDGRRGILVKNGSVLINYNYIHLTDENPTTLLTTAPTGIQLSVSATASANIQSQMTYGITNNKIGKYAKVQTSATSDPAGILGDVDTNQNLNIDRTKMNIIYISNTFDANTDCYTCIFDYSISKYTQGIFKSETVAKTMMGNNYEYLNTGLSVQQIDNIWKIVPSA